ncbi:unnamed protein product [Anisakis simplex]|uniref:Tetratricopeptide repeat protein, tpr, putative (inferred by orthology to a S. mansoni protein) n=1 Tax=Anisakis simplex TaxID=6269 RepID=A0A0M3J884_ANISI|nr:unnamed protein product [Anisakis simplex]
MCLAKLDAKYDEVLNDVDSFCREQGNDPYATLRALRLVAEAYAVKGFSIEAILKRGSTAQQPTSQQQQQRSRMNALYCFEKSAELTISYVNELEKSLASTTRVSSGTILSSQQSNGVNAGRSFDKMGDLLESSLERVPLLRLRRNVCDCPWGVEGIEWYRHIMTSLGDKLVGEKLQQRFAFICNSGQIFQLSTWISFVMRYCESVFISVSVLVLAINLIVIECNRV